MREVDVLICPGNVGSLWLHGLGDAFLSEQSVEERAHALLLFVFALADCLRSFRVHMLALWLGLHIASRFEQVRDVDRGTTLSRVS